MRRRGAGIVVSALLLGGVAGYLAGGRRGSDAIERGSGGAVDVAALRERVADLERQVARLSERPEPVATLSGLRPRALSAGDEAAGGGSGGTESSGLPAPPTESNGPSLGDNPAEAAGGSEPTTAAVTAIANGFVFFVRKRADADPDVDATRLAELTELFGTDPEAATRAARDLWERGTECDRATAVAAASSASHGAVLPLVNDMLSATPPPRRAGDLIKRAAAAKGSAWHPVQMTGPPDVPIAGDHMAAWASLKEDMGEVVLDLHYATAVRVEAVRIHETDNGGAIARVYAKVPSGRFDLLWEGRAETPEAIRWFEPSVSTSYATSSIRIVLDTDRVRGWNEIDAVELVGDGRRQWATGANASSTYGTGQ